MKKVIILAAIVFIASVCRAQTSKAFNWVAWEKVTPATKTELKKIKADKDGTAYDNIIETLEERCEIEVAVLDMDGDGKMEYAVGCEGSFCCGSLGCSLNVYTDGGKRQVNLIDDWRSVKPAKDGVVSSKGKLIRFETRRW